MKKSLFAMGLSAGLFVAGCDGVTEGDIENATRAAENADQASGLRLAVGQFWAQSANEKETTEDGTVSTAGAFNADSSTARSTEIGGKTVSKVMGVTYVESADKNGFAIATVSQEDVNKVTTGITTVDTASGLLQRSGFVLFELGDWVRSATSDHDADSDQGSALHPINPRIGLLYTDDNGHIFKGEQAETVAGFDALKLTRQFPAQEELTVEDFYATCFVETPGTVGKDVTRRASCEGTVINMGSGDAEFAVKHSESIWVGRQLLLKTVSETETIRVDHILCDTAPQNLDDPTALLLDDCEGTISFGRFGGDVKTTKTSTSDVTKFGKSADVKAEPTIEDAN